MDARRILTRPLFVRAAIAGVVALVGYSASASFGNPPDEGLITKLTDDDVVFDGDLIALAGGILFVLAALIAMRAVARAAGKAMEQELGDARGAPLTTVVTLLGYAVVAFATMGILGVNLTGLLLGGAITGVVVGIAAQQTLGNVFAGIVLLVVRPFSVGEYLVLRSGALGGEYEGRVTEMGLFYVDLVTSRGPVKLPNAGVLAGAVGPGARGATEKETGADKKQDEEAPADGTARPADGSPP